jgi:hypothetical protein
MMAFMHTNFDLENKKNQVIGQRLLIKSTTEN